MNYGGSSKGCYGIGKAKRIHARRSARAKKIDESLKAPLAKSDEQRLAQPNRFDVPDVDTPKDTVSKEEQDRRFQETNRFESHQSPTSHSRFRANLNAHKLSGNTY